MSPPFYYDELLKDEFGRYVALSPCEKAVSVCIGLTVSIGWIAWLAFM
jgi:hypothetical protein